MTDRKTPGTVFTDDSIDTRAPTRSPDAPVSTGDILGANSLLTYQDMSGQPLQAKIDAYLPIVNELDQRDKRSWSEKVFGPQYLTGVTAGLPVNTTKVWDDIARIRATDPSFLKDVPAKNDDEFDAWVKSNETMKRRQAQDVVRREQGFGQQALGFGAGAVTGLTDPINLGAMVMTGGLGGGGKTLLQSMAREALINSAIEAVELPATNANRSRFGEQMTVGDAFADVGMAAAGGAAFPIGGRILGKVSAPVGSVIGRAFNAAGDSLDRAAALRQLRGYDVSDADIARAFGQAVPPDVRLPDEQAAINVIDRNSDVAGASPFAATPGGLDANVEHLGNATDALTRPATAGRGTSPNVSRGTGRVAQPLTQDRVISFVINDLEGGATVVPYSQADGGTTKYGVAKKFNPDVDVANITETDAKRIARQRYWLPEFNTVDPRVAAIAFDANWIRSPSLARRIVREAGDDAGKALEIYRAELMHVADTVPGKGKYRRGWNNRVDKLARFVGDAEPSRVALAPEAFDGDDVAWRAQAEDLNRQELQLADDTPSRPDPVRDFVDRLGRGDDLSAPDDVRFAADNRPAIDAEMQMRADAGADGHPDLLGGDVPRETLSDVPQPSAAETALAVRHYVDQVTGEISAERVAGDLGITDEAARKALALVDQRPAARPGARAEFDATSSLLDNFDVGVDPDRPLFHVEWNGRHRVVSTPEAARRAMLSFASQSGDYDRVFKRVTNWGGKDADFRGVSVRQASERQLEREARERLPDDEPVSAPPSLSPETHGIGNAGDAEARAVADSLYHDLKAIAASGDEVRVPLVEGGPELRAADLVESIARDEDAIAKARACL
jgi:hypothetical protein